MLRILFIKNLQSNQDKIIIFFTIIWKHGEIITCYGKYNSTEGNPSFFLVPCEIMNDIQWIYCSHNRWIEFYDIVDSDATNECEPNTKYGSKAFTHFLSSKSLKGEEADQDSY